MIIDVVSESSGKDSTAALLVALETRPRENIRVAFADTGNEHEMCYEYLNYLEAELELEIVRLRADFTDWWWHRRDYIRDNWHKPHKDWPQGVPADAIERALGVFERGPTGNPYLDLCIIKGRFPGRKVQFCTQELKTGPLVNYQLQFMEQGNAVWSWQGIRAAEGGRRAHAKGFEEVGGGLYIHRPILRWTAADCFEAMRYYGLKPNPLYKLGGARVGCMPCINCSKEELTEIAKRFPEQRRAVGGSGRCGEQAKQVVILPSARGRPSGPAGQEHPGARDMGEHQPRRPAVHALRRRTTTTVQQQLWPL